jgi:ketosteroid isomerase-like protein
VRRALTVVTIITMAVLLASAQTRHQTAKDRIAEEAIRNLSGQEVDGLMRGDVKVLAQIWSDDFVVTNPFNKFVTKQEVLGMTASGFLAFTSYDRQIEYVRVYGDHAVVAGSESVGWAGKLPTAGTSSQLRFTSIWMKQKGRWQEIARHANIIVAALH